MYYSSFPAIFLSFFYINLFFVLTLEQYGLLFLVWFQIMPATQCNAAAKCLLTVPETSCMEQKSPLTQANLCLAPRAPGAVPGHTQFWALYKFLPSSVFLPPCLDQGDMEIFGSTLWAAEVAAGFQSSSIFLLACINGAAVPVSPFEPVPSWPKANTIPQELRWCCPFWCGAWLPVAWNAMPCREVEGSAQEIKFLTTVETSVGQGTASCFLRLHSECMEFALLLCSTILEWEPGGEGSDEWNSVCGAKLSPWSEDQIRRWWSTETSVQKRIKARTQLQ